MPSKEEESSSQDNIIGFFVLIRPLIAKLMLQAILVYIAVISFQKYQQSEQVASTFLAELQQKLVTDVKIEKYVEGGSCPEDYEEIEAATFPGSIAGCRCDLDILDEDICAEISQEVKDQSDEKECKEQITEMAEVYADKEPNRLLQPTEFDKSKTGTLLSRFRAKAMQLLQNH